MIIMNYFRNVKKEPRNGLGQMTGGMEDTQPYTYFHISFFRCASIS